MGKRWYWSIGLSILTVLSLSACTGAPTPSDPDGPILNGFQALPKALATVQPSPTSAVTDTPTPVPPTDTPLPPTMTLSPTPYVGIFLGAATRPELDGTFTWQPTGNAVIVIFTPVPGFHPTAAPVAFNGASGIPIVAPNPAPLGTPNACTTSIAQPFANAYGRNAGVAARLGCPTNLGYSLHLVEENFQTGVMFWRETKDIYALSTANLAKGAPQDAFWRVTDSWTDGLPASDPTLKPPAGTTQPVRGFGYAWRNNPSIRNGLGWALDAEQSYNGMWQDFAHGFMLSSNNGAVYALLPTDGPPPTTGYHFGALPQ